MRADALLIHVQEGRRSMYTQSGSPYSVRTDHALIALARLLSEIAENSTPSGIAVFPAGTRATTLILDDDIDLSSAANPKSNSNGPKVSISSGKVHAAKNLVSAPDSTPSVGGSL